MMHIVASCAWRLEKTKTRRDVITPPCTKIETCSNIHVQRIFHMLVMLALSKSTAYVVRSYRACPRWEHQQGDWLKQYSLDIPCLIYMFTYSAPRELLMAIHDLHILPPSESNVTLIHTFSGALFSCFYRTSICSFISSVGSQRLVRPLRTTIKIMHS